MKCSTTERTAKAHAEAMGKANVELVILRDGLTAEPFVLTRAEAKDLAAELLKAAGAKFTLSV